MSNLHLFDFGCRFVIQQSTTSNTKFTIAVGMSRSGLECDGMVSCTSTRPPVCRMVNYASQSACKCNVLCRLIESALKRKQLIQRNTRLHQRHAGADDYLGLRRAIDYDFLLLVPT